MVEAVDGLLQLSEPPFHISLEFIHLVLHDFPSLHHRPMDFVTHGVAIFRSPFQGVQANLGNLKENLETREVVPCG